MFQKYTICYPINRRYRMSKVISYISTLSDITENTIIGKTTTVMMTTHLISNTVIPPKIRDSFLSSLKIGGKNTGSTRAKQKLLQLLPLTQLMNGLSLIKSWRLLMIKE